MAIDTKQDVEFQALLEAICCEQNHPLSIKENLWLDKFILMDTPLSTTRTNMLHEFILSGEYDLSKITVMSCYQLDKLIDTLRVEGENRFQKIQMEFEEPEGEAWAGQTVNLYAKDTFIEAKRLFERDDIRVEVHYVQKLFQ
jgi:hypothetical protein